MKKIMALIALGVLLSACRLSVGKRPLIVSTIPVFKQVAIYIGGTDFNYYSILKGGESPHGYEPKPSDILKVRKCKLLIMHGLGLDNWILKAVKDKKKVMNVGKLFEKRYPFIKSPGYHIWANPILMEDVYFEVSRKLTSFYPDKKVYYEKRADDAAQFIEQIVSKIQSKISKLKNRKVIAFHPVWKPFFETVGIECVGYLSQNPSEGIKPERVKELIDLGRKEHVRVVIAEVGEPQEPMRKIASAIGAKLVILNPIPDKNYLSVISEWGEKLYKALKEMQLEDMEK